MTKNVAFYGLLMWISILKVVFLAISISWCFNFRNRNQFRFTNVSSWGKMWFCMVPVLHEPFFYRIIAATRESPDHHFDDRPSAAQICWSFLWLQLMLLNYLLISFFSSGCVRAQRLPLVSTDCKARRKGFLVEHPQGFDRPLCWTARYIGLFHIWHLHVAGL